MTMSQCQFSTNDKILFIKTLFMLLENTYIFYPLSKSIHENFKF